MTDTLTHDVHAALDAGELDRALLLANALPDPVHKAQWAGLVLRAQRKTTELYAQAEALVAAQPDPARAHVQAARLCFNGSVLGRSAEFRLGLLHEDLPAAHAHAVAATRADPRLAGAWIVLGEIEDKLDRSQECLAAFERAVACEPADTQLRLRLALLRRQRGDRRGALNHLIAGLQQAPKDPDLLSEHASLLVELNDDEEGSEAIERALQARPEALLTAIGRWIRLGDLDAAEQAIADHLPSPDARAAAARLALWRGDDEAALSLAREVLAAQDHPVARLVRAAVALRQGAPADAAVDLDAVLEAVRGVHDDSFLDETTALTWRALAALALGQRTEAAALASRAMASSAHYALIAHMVRLLAEIDPRSEQLDPGAWEHLAKKIDGLVDDPAALWTGRQEAVVAALHEVLGRFQGNRSTMPTLLDEGELMRFEVPEHPRHTARKLEHGLRSSPVDAVVARYRNLQRRHADDPTPHTYCGEVLLWAGRYEEAIVQFRKALKIDRTTTWAWIGWGAAQHQQGQHEAALQTWAEGVQASRYEGPTLFAYRGEAHLRLGTTELARADLDTALREKPQRLSAWILRALLSLHEGAHHPAKVVCAVVRARLPGLWLDATAAAGLDPLQLDPPQERLEALLTCLRGNRSSTMITWFDRDEHLRVGWWRAAWLTSEHLTRRAPT
jgi:tetratricopeptide (TPR) repeat protein